MSLEDQSYVPKPTYSVEKLNILFSDLFIKYADKQDDHPDNVQNGNDFTAFEWNIHHKNFVLDDITKSKIQDDINTLCILERDYRIHLKNHFDLPEIIDKKLSQIEKVFTIIKKIYPDVKISENIRSI